MDQTEGQMSLNPGDEVMVCLEVDETPKFLRTVQAVTKTGSDRGDLVAENERKRRDRRRLTFQSRQGQS